MLQEFSIKTRLLFLSDALILMIAGATYFLTTRLADNSRAVTRNAELAELIDIAQDVRNIFGQFRYWTTDLAVSQLRQSEVNANAARERLSRRLNDFAASKPVEAATLKRQIADFENAALTAVERYTDDERVLGNTFLAQAANTVCSSTIGCRPWSTISIVKSFRHGIGSWQTSRKQRVSHT